MSRQKPVSASKRRAQQRQQRDQQARTQQSRGRRERQTSKSGWWLVGGIVLLVAVIVGAFLFVARYEAQQSQIGSDKALKTITSVDANIFARVDKGTFSGHLSPVKSTPILKGPDGKPEVFYMGGEYCPHCAAQRWVVIAALSRFGKFNNLTPILSGEGQVPTYTFYKSTYSSDYINFESKETADNGYPTPQQLESLSAADQAIVQQYAKPPYVQDSGIPFMSIGNQFISSGAYYPENVLTGQSYQNISDQVTDSNSDLSRGVIGAANILTAAICVATNNQPAKVCAADPVPGLQKTLLAQASASSGNPMQLASINQPLAWDLRRRN
ncbi:hypothetical protein KDA_60820 [Dictyobacter alpinus]|uniref:DUF929 domain-containing protein n=1 Tax=Dictyobacter alpinus TaxID=2014873 RepID=A0A402BGP0_9CHLR|nr:DUF929 family protein [Dictyobacter alpinus]GCE30598.1 hypothetical protein KDA_60820 [Dictyobacter alpinus]